LLRKATAAHDTRAVVRHTRNSDTLL
jgi:hypothetical protein